MKKVREGVPCSEESLKEYNQTWQDMEDCFREIEEKEEKISPKKDKKNSVVDTLKKIRQPGQTGRKSV